MCVEPLTLKNGVLIAISPLQVDVGFHCWPLVDSIPLLGSNGVQKEQTPQKLFASSVGPEWGATELPLPFTPSPTLVWSIHLQEQRDTGTVSPGLVARANTQVWDGDTPRTQNPKRLSSSLRAPLPPPPPELLPSCRAALQVVQISLSARQQLQVRAVELRASQGESLECSVNEARARVRMS